MKYNIISSSSSGNCIIVENKLMLDCGVSYAKIKNNIKGIKLIFISHGHKDHLNPTTIRKISYENPNIKFLTGSHGVVSKLTKNGVPMKNIFYIETINGSKWFDLGLVRIKLEPLEHDVENYCLHFEIYGNLGIYITDTADISNIKAKGYDLYLVENNYQTELLNEHIEECKLNNDNENKLFYLERVKRTHLSAEKANSFLIDNMSDNSDFCYIHQSEYNYRKED